MRAPRPWIRSIDWPLAQSARSFEGDSVVPPDVRPVSVPDTARIPQCPNPEDDNVGPVLARRHRRRASTGLALSHTLLQSLGLEHARHA